MSIRCCSWCCWPSSPSPDRKVYDIEKDDDSPAFTPRSSPPPSLRINESEDRYQAIEEPIDCGSPRSDLGKSTLNSRNAVQIFH